MNKVALSVIFAVGAVTVSALAFAGAKVSGSVWIGNGTVEGSVAGASKSADGVQYIGCYSFKSSDGAGWSGCYAQNSAGVYKSCMTTDPDMVQIIRSIGPGAAIKFSVPDGSSTCSFVKVSNDSQYFGS